MGWQERRPHRVILGQADRAGEEGVEAGQDAPDEGGREVQGRVRGRRQGEPGCPQPAVRGQGAVLGLRMQGGGEEGAAGGRGGGGGALLLQPPPRAAARPRQVGQAQAPPCGLRAQGGASQGQGEGGVAANDVGGGGGKGEGAVGERDLRG